MDYKYLACVLVIFKSHFYVQTACWFLYSKKVPGISWDRSVPDQAEVGIIFRFGHF